jgi:hypothetical protein
MMVDMSRFFKRKKKEEKKEEIAESLLKQLCGDDAKLYDVLASLLYSNPMAGITQNDLEILIEEQEKNIKEKNYEEAMLKNGLVLNKAIFEATQKPREKGRYIKVIQDLASKSVLVTEKVKEMAEKDGLTDKVASLERGIENYKFIGERIEDVLNVASQFYNELLVTLGETERREERGETRREAEREEKRKEEKKRGETRKEAEREEKGIEEREKEKREERREMREAS